jgi:hypothetical protein
VAPSRGADSTSGASAAIENPEPQPANEKQLRSREAANYRLKLRASEAQVAILQSENEKLSARARAAEKSFHEIAREVVGLFGGKETTS